MGLQSGKWDKIWMKTYKVQVQVSEIGKTILKFIDGKITFFCGVTEIMVVPIEQEMKFES